MWYVEYKLLSNGQVERWEGLTKEQAMEIHRKYSGWQGGTAYARAGLMEFE
jgi:hypothetical protein